MAFDGRAACRMISAVFVVGMQLSPAFAADAAPTDQDWAIHGQATFVVQGTPGFRSPYVGSNSLTPDQTEETVDVTAFAGVRPWAGAELWFNPEVDQGFGLSNTLGAAGFPSAEAYKVGKADPYVRIQRLFFRQTIGFGGDQETVEGAANQMAGSRSAHRLVLTIGKMGVGDIFDTNAYAHDPRADFLNWSIVDGGAFDYAADAWGYSYGAAAEYYRGPWALRVGLYNLSKVPNGEVLENDLSQNQIVWEIEHRHNVASHAGTIRATFFRNHGRFARFDEALGAARGSEQAPDLTPLRRMMTRIGGVLNVEQEITGPLGLFARASIADGEIEPYDFTDIDRSVALGGQLKGSGWGRSQDRVGFAGVVNAISAAHRAYLAAGGVGVLVGDGQLPHYGSEKIAEAYYDWRPISGIDVTADYQFIADPGYNRDRGPAQVFALRLHGSF